MPVGGAPAAQPVFDTKSKDIAKSAAAEAQAMKNDDLHDKDVALADAYWKQKSKEKDWDCIIPGTRPFCACSVNDNN